ncbi:MAG: CRISPR-associated endonuclease Cas2 [Terracidiphilus sp.]
MDGRKHARTRRARGVIFWQRTASSLWLLTYDIPEPLRLQRIAKIAGQYGIRWQRSVFGLTLSSAKQQDLLHELKRTIDIHRDDVQLFHLPPGTRLGSNVPDDHLGDCLAIVDPE